MSVALKWMPVESLQWFVPAAPIGTGPSLLVVPDALPVNSVQELIALGALVCAMPFLGVPLRPGLLLCALPLSVQVALTLGIGWILGVAHVYFRDTAQVVVAVAATPRHRDEAAS